MHKAYDALELGRFDRAISIGEKLIARQFSGGYEALARGLYMNGEAKRAIAVLEEGVRKFPGVYLLWSYLGEFYSNVGSYQDALAAFHRCEMAGDNSGIPLYNIAVVYARMGDGVQAEQFVDRLTPQNEEQAQAIAAVRCWALILQERWQEALDLCREFLRKKPENLDIAAYEAYALMKIGKREEALEKAWQVVESNRSQNYALDTIREIGDQHTEEARRFELIVSGRMNVTVTPGRDFELPYMRVYYVQARDPEDAMRYVEPFERSSLIPLKLERAKLLDEEAKGCDGVYEFQEHYMGTPDMVPWWYRWRMKRVR